MFPAKSGAFSVITFETLTENKYGPDPHSAKRMAHGAERKQLDKTSRRVSSWSSRSLSVNVQVPAGPGPTKGTVIVGLGLGGTGHCTVGMAESS